MCTNFLFKNIAIRWVFLIGFCLVGCNHQKVADREKVRIKNHVTEIEEAYKAELEITDQCQSAPFKQKQILFEELRELIMMHGESYKADYQLTFLNRYRAYPFLKVLDDIEAKIKFLSSRLKFFENDDFKQNMSHLIERLDNLRKIIFIHPHYEKECARYQKCGLIESAADFASREIEDLRERVLETEKRLNLLTEKLKD
ncbi:TPA: hypothetical protein DIC20_00060 [Candidatus Dependentiae bacterium]|nr:MAG: hypothetical protein US03_C0016G0002 [candidate division TM6 bacterium GW2011_GWF2_36_131]KKQ02602.1 MAG: hypothetical protein US13_C0013G0024 [candidate division TM6 bacterium GW2011_GWE2_36_25]KKQ19051.1 MAG: hypothetical protein US32_C0017G0002 [candidate division TM6 bacterium GW2011_GWA2_36_9]HBR70187.1 hypothetical protein [Candidatus Dependentiae bacterium]HCU00081.1 hypothetical protein [Candidatus Dependentiae bacterium]